eukprot:12763065-Alexandrium_andersonii.AAC.1
MPSAAAVRKAALRAGASAPGVDGPPRELFHVGVDFRQLPRGPGVLSGPGRRWCPVCRPGPERGAS